MEQNHKERMEAARSIISALPNGNNEPTKQLRETICRATGAPQSAVNDLLKARRKALGIYQPSLKGHVVRLRTQAGANVKIKKNPSLLFSNGVCIDKWEV